MTTKTTISWDDLRQVKATELAPGDRFYKPSLGEAYWVSGETGKVRGAMLFAEMDGTLWTVERIGIQGTIYATAEDGRTAHQRPKATSTVLRVETEKQR